MNSETFLAGFTVLRLVGSGAVGLGPAAKGRLVQCNARIDTTVRGQVVEFDRESATTRSFESSRAEFSALAHQLRDLCNRRLDVTTVWDTSDAWIRLTLEIFWNDRRTCLHLTLMSSGFEGEDAGALEQLLLEIDRLAGN